MKDIKAFTAIQYKKDGDPVVIHHKDINKALDFLSKEVEHKGVESAVAMYADGTIIKTLVKGVHF